MDHCKGIAVVYALCQCGRIRECTRRGPCVRSLQSWDSNCLPLSVVMVSGMPKRATQPLTKVNATVSAVMSGMGKASGQRLNQSMQVSR